MNHVKEKNISKVIIILIIVLIILSILSSYTIGLNNDELFTMGLIKHGYRSLIDIDSLDVHPPLYYLILKFFLQITTFWTSSIFIKIIFARFFSLICFIVTINILFRILKLCKIKYEKDIQILAYLIFPIIVFYSVDIRMYQFSTMLLAIEIYGLFLFKYNAFYRARLYGISFSFISLTLLFYTNYFSAVFASALLLVDVLGYLYNNEIRKCFLLFLLELLSLISFIPCFKFAINQFLYVTHSNYSNFVSVPKLGRNLYSQLLGAFVGNNVDNMKSLILDILFLLLEIYLLCLLIKDSKHNRFKELIITLYLAYIIGFSPSIIMSIITHPMIQWRYGFPMFSIILFLLSSIFINKVFHKHIIILFITIFILTIMNVKYINTNINNDIYYIKYIRMMPHFDKMYKNHRCMIMHVKNDAQTDIPLYYSICLSNHNNERLVVYNLPVKRVLASNNKLLINKVFNNVYFKNNLNK